MSFDDSFLGFGTKKSSTKKRSKRKGGKSIFDSGLTGGLGKGLGGGLGKGLGDFGGGLGGKGLGGDFGGDFGVGRKNGGKRKDLAKDAASGFESPGIFEGLKQPRSERNGERNGQRNGGGLPIPELGTDFNDRFGQIGTGFVERVDPFKIGFSDVLTGNGRTGEIIGSGSGFVSGTRGRGRPKGSGKVGRPKGSTKLRGPVGKGLEIDSSEVKELRKAGKLKGTKSRSVGSLLKESAVGGIGSVREKFRGDPIRASRSIDADTGGEVGFGTSRDALERETDVDREQVDRFRVGLAVEQEVETEKESLLEDEEEDSGMDEDIENGGDDFGFEVKEGQIRRRNGE